MTLVNDVSELPSKGRYNESVSIDGYEGSGG